MATRQQRVKVGVFMLISTGLMVWGLVVIAGYRHGERIAYWVEFEESVLGLSVGNMVEYNGVPVGAIEAISVTPENTVKVDFSVETAKIQLREGVRAKLVIYSIATGTMYISLSGGDPNAPYLSPTSQIPTEPSLVAALGSQSQSLIENLVVISDQLREGLAGMQEGQLTRLVDQGDLLVRDGQDFVEELTGTVQEVRESALGGLEDFRKLVRDIDDVAGNLNELLKTTKEKVDPLNVTQTQDELNRVLKNAGDLTEKLKSTVDLFDKTSTAVLHDTDNVEHSLRRSLQTLEETLESVRTLADYLEKDPASLIRGKGRPKGEE